MNGVIKMAEKQDKLIVQGILSEGFGTIPKLIMKDDELTIEAKAIYAYIASYAGAGQTAFPGISLICHDLDITETRFHKHKKRLIEKGYIEIHKERSNNGTFGRNVYTIKTEVKVKEKNKPTPQNKVSVPTHQNPTLDKPTSDNPTTENKVSNINSNNINSINTNNNKNIQQQPASSEPPKINFIQTWEKSGFGIMPPLTIEKLDGWVKDFDDNEEIIIKAIELANDNNARSYAYVNSILKNWESKGVKTLNDIDAIESERQAAFEEKKNKSAAPRHNYNKKPVRTEKLPDWAKDEAKPVEDKPVSAEAERELQERLARIRKLQKGE